jgi:hypothetical protein
MSSTHTIDGSLDGSTIVNGDRIEHDLLIPEILRRGAERLIQDGATPHEWPAEGPQEQHETR